MTKKQFSIITILSAVILLLLLLLSQRFWFRLDLTASKAFTLSPVSRNLHAEIDDNVRISYFLSGRLHTVGPAPSEISDLLREYEARSRGTIQVSIKDPGRNTAEVERFGLFPQELQNVGQDEASFSIVYSGIVIEYLNKFEVLPWVFSLDTLEYDITSRIRSLVSGRRREMGVIAPVQQKTWTDYYSDVYSTLVQAGYSVLELRPGEEIPDTLPVLFVMGGAEELDEYSLYRIDRYIQLGGRVLFSVASVDVDLFSNAWEGRFFYDRGLLAMVSFYGVTIGQSLVMDSASLVIPFRDFSNQLRLTRYPPWLGVMEDQANRNHPLTARFGGVDMYWACPLTFTLPESGTVSGEVLFTSSDEAWLMTDDFSLRPENIAAFTLGMETSMGQYMLAAALEGTFPSWFEGVETPRRQNREWEELEEWDEWDFMDIMTEEELPPMPLSPRESRIVVVGDTDMGGPLIRFTQNQPSPNLNFILQAADWLGMDDDIVGIRNRQGGQNRLDRIIDNDRRLGYMRFSRILNIYIMPLLISGFGIMRLVKRKAKKEQDHGV